jgi:hypothetical protein
MMSGDYISQQGHGNIGKAEHQGPGHIVAGGQSVHSSELKSSAIDNLLVAIDALRKHLDERELADVDSAVQQINSNSTPSEFKQPLGRIAGIATMLGDVGVPVISAIKELLGVFSSS